ncbi:uncharacterized protein KZ484_023488 [Pholidichthys leucotaenia]
MHRRGIKKPALAEVFQSRQELHQTTIMKFVALAFVLLLAVGSQAASIHAEPQSHLQHARAGLDMFLSQLKDSLLKSLNGLDDTEYSELKHRLSQKIEGMHNSIKALQAQVSPMTDSVVSTLAEATAEFRAAVTTDIDELKKEVEPQHQRLVAVINKHIDEYRSTLQPIFEEYSTKHQAEMEALKTRLEPVMEQLRPKIEANIEETKAALMPIVESVRSKLQQRVADLKAMVQPHVEEYSDQLKLAMVQIRDAKPEQLDAVKAQAEKSFASIKESIQRLAQVVTETFTQS